MTPIPSPPSTAAARRALAIGIIGAGRLGTALAGALAAAGYTRIRLASRSDARAHEVSRALALEPALVSALVEECALVFLAVPDRAVAVLAAEQPWSSGQGVVHVSGALSLNVLAPAAARGALAGCVHPIQTFPAVDRADREGAAARFVGITCGVEAPAPLDALLDGVVSDLGAGVVRLEGVDRALYHAAAVLVSNDVVALMATATRTWAAAGLREEAAREALAPLLTAAASNVARLPLAEALTGPVARGDVETVRRHLEALEREPEIAGIYRALARELLRLDLGHDAAVRAAFEAMLSGK